MENVDVLDDEVSGVEVDPAIVKLVRGMKGWCVALCVGCILGAFFMSYFTWMSMRVLNTAGINHNLAFGVVLFVILTLALYFATAYLFRIVKQIERVFLNQTQDKLLQLLRSIKSLFVLVVILIVSSIGGLIVSSIVNFIQMNN